MKIKVILLLHFMLISIISFAQTVQYQKPHIQVSGTAEKEIAPDELFILITLVEKNKLSVEQQENELKTAIKNLGVDLSNLELSDADATYMHTRIFSKDVITTKNYLLKVATAEMLGKVFEELNRLEIKNADLIRVDYSKKAELKRQLKIDAIKAAKEKAIYMTEAIGEQIGKPLSINETENIPVTNSPNIFSYQQKVSIGGASGGTYREQDTINYKKIKFATSVDVVFEIK